MAHGSLRRDRWIWLGLLAGLLLRIGLAVAGVGQPPARFEYDTLAEHLLAGQGYVIEHLASVPYRVYYSGAPFVMLVAAARAMTDSDLPLQAAQSAFTLAAALGVAALAQRVAGLRGARLAAAVAALHPGLAFYDVARIHPLGFDTLLGVLAVVLGHRLLQGPLRPTLTLACGAVLGLALLQRPSLWLLPSLIVLALARRQRWRAAALTMCGAGLMLAPWLARSWQVTGRTTLSTTTAEHAYLGNAPGSSGGALLPDGTPVLATLPPEVWAELARTDEVGQGRVFGRLLRDEFHSHPAHVLLRIAGKASTFWALPAQAGALYPRAWRWLYLGPYAMLFALALLGLARVPAYASLTCRLIVVTCVSVWLTHALLYFELRHRFALEPLLAVLAAVAVSRFSPTAAAT